MNGPILKVIYFYTSLVDTLPVAVMSAWMLQQVIGYNLTEAAQSFLFGGPLGYVPVFALTWIILSLGNHYSPDKRSEL